MAGAASASFSITSGKSLMEYLLSEEVVVVAAVAGLAAAAAAAAAALPPWKTRRWRRSGLGGGGPRGTGEAPFKVQHCIFFCFPTKLLKMHLPSVLGMPGLLHSMEDEDASSFGT